MLWRKHQISKKENILLENEIVRQQLQTIRYQQSLYTIYQRACIDQQERFSELQKFAAIGRVTLGLLHDISNPIIFASFLAEKQGDKNAKLMQKGLKEVSNLITSARRQLINQTKSLTFYPVTEIRYAITFLNYPLQQRHLSCYLEAEKNVRAFGDPHKFYKCVSNLLSNAIEAYPIQRKVTQRKGIKITLKKGKDMILFEIEDFGSGIPQKYQNNIFKPLFTTKKPSEGTGIGLSETKEIVENSFRGTLAFRSIEGEGTVFSVNFPLPCQPP
ncbi:MAG TPA: HAMP domain-containing sensor histidine kinase [Candidatus Saccharimonadia bacterium]|nr:HAMP domain-containing sensor histidine kinase [Candidatus Saccharimonadia bacterium]